MARKKLYKIFRVVVQVDVEDLASCDHDGIYNGEEVTSGTLPLMFRKQSDAWGGRYHPYHVMHPTNIKVTATCRGVVAGDEGVRFAGDQD